MKLITKRDLIRNIVDTWEEQDQGDDYKDKYEITEELKKLDLETATADDVNNIIGNNSWTRLICDSCYNDVEAVILMGSDFEYIESSINICVDCIHEANKLITDAKL